MFKSILRYNNVINISVRSTSWKIDKSKVPILKEHDLEEEFIKGSGPGGQCVNKSVNCCYLVHKPTRLFVKVHQDRRLEKNRALARELLTIKLDNLINGEDSVENQKKKNILEKKAIKDAQREALRNMKKVFKEQMKNSESTNE